MKKQEHEQVIREIRLRHQAELQRAGAFWQAEAEMLQRVCDTYAATIDAQDAEIAALHQQLENEKEANVGRAGSTRTG